MFYVVHLESLIETGLRHFKIPFSGEMVKSLLFYVLELEKWNAHINLSGLKDGDAIVERLLYDALFVSGYLRERKYLLDLGSGSGIIAIPLKILHETMDVVSVDKNPKKVHFQRHVKRSLSLKGFTPIHHSIETLAPLGVDSLVVKGFGPIRDILEKGRRHMQEGGRAFILKGKREEIVQCEGFSLESVVPYLLPKQENAYRLFIYKKVRGSANPQPPYHPSHPRTQE